jgi:hypothetical protein
MTIQDVVSKRGIKEILHFTTNKGLLGILASGALKSRARLPNEQLLEYVYEPNCAERRDGAWLDYVNLSITKINSRLFGISSGSWHRSKDVWWCVLAFDPVVLSHPGVFFATTNNMYTGVRREQGVKGLDALFANKIIRWSGNEVYRPKTHPPHYPTCVQAEALYPKELSTDYLRHVYVATDVHLDVIGGQCQALRMPMMPCSVRPDVFSEGL